MYASEIKSTVANGNAIWVSTSCRVLGLFLKAGQGNGNIVFIDGGAGGRVRDAYTVSAGDTQYVLLPGVGVRFFSNVFVCVPAGAVATLHFDPMGY